MTAGLPSVRAAIFDFNGTLSDDEPILYGIYAAMFAERGRPLSRSQYAERLAGLSDEEIIRRWLGEQEDVEALAQERVRRYCAVCDGATIREPARDAVRYAAALMPVAIVSGAATVEIDRVLQIAGIRDAFSVIVGCERVSAAKPDPAGYRLALSELSAFADGLVAEQALAFEDTGAGITAAKRAGLRCVAVRGTVPAAQLAAADAVIDSVSETAIVQLLR